MNFQNLRIGQLNLKIEILKFENDRLNFENDRLDCKLDPHNPQQSRHFVDPAFFAIMRFPLKKARLVFFVFLKKTIFRKQFGVATYFCFYFKRENKIRKKNPKCDS